MEGAAVSRLYSEGAIGALRTRNRLVMTAMHSAYNEGGVAGDATVEFYRRRARGGAGLIVVGAAGIDPTRLNEHGMLQLCDDRFLPGLRRLARAVRDEGCAVFPQLMHPGRYAKSKEYGGREAVAPSAVPSRFTGETPRELRPEEIEQLAAWYGEAAARAREAGFDGVEVTAASGYLLAQFLSPLTNRRSDRYGGGLAFRLAFPLEVIAAIRKAVGPGFPLMMRVAGSDFMPGGNGWAESAEVCRAFEAAGADAIDVTGGWHETGVPQLTMEVPQGAFAYLGRKVKEAVRLPVVVCNRLSPQVAERLVDEGSADFAGLARGFLADPDLAAKAARGDYAHIRPCVACNQGCMDRIFSGGRLACAVNAEAGREAEQVPGGRSPTEARCAKSKKVLVVGGGMAGLEFARAASLRGLAVTVWEGRGSPGGQARIAARIPGRREFLRFAEYLEAECARLGARVVLGKRATAAEVLDEAQSGGFDQVVIATGKRPRPPALETDGSVAIESSWDVIEGRAAAGRRVVVAGGGAQGVQAALLLAKAGTVDAATVEFLMRYRAERPDDLYGLMDRGLRTVTVVEEGKGIGRDLGPSTRWSMLMLLRQLGVTTVDRSRVLGVERGAVLVERGAGGEPGGGRIALSADTLVVAAGFAPDAALYEELSGKIGALRVIGDARRASGAMEAVRDAYDLASEL